MRARHKEGVCRGGVTKDEDLARRIGMSRIGSAYKRDNASASSFNSEGKRARSYCQRKAIFLHEISREIVFIPGEVDLSCKASLRELRLSPLMTAPVFLKVSSNVRRIMNSVAYSKTVWLSQLPSFAFRVVNVSGSHLKRV